MRMTNKIMQTNSLYNINQTKVAEDKYNTQLTSQSRITRPSDDPVIAIRALRLRSNVSTAQQYYEKNAPDANQWLDVTSQSLHTITSVITDLYKQVETGVNKDYTASDMQVLLTQIKQNTEETYATGNQDYAGRYIFTGYRTDTPLTMQKEQIDADNKLPAYKITEKIKANQIDTFNYTDYSVFDTAAGADAADELQIKNASIGRIRLSYTNIGSLTDFTDPDGNNIPSIEVTDKNGNPVTTPSFTGFTTAADAETAYKQMTAAENTDPVPKTVIYIPKTGELIYDSNTAKELGDFITDGGNIRITYTKNEWLVGDLNPQHYFRCEDSKGIVYNSDGNVDTEITYDVGYNQTIQVNTNAAEVFDPGIMRDLDDLTDIVTQFAQIETIRNKYKDEYTALDETDPDYKDAKRRFDAADKAYTYIRDAVSKRFGDQITRYQQYLDSTNVAITKNGTRSTRLQLIKDRLESQQSTFRELQEENEGIDMTEVAVLLTAAETTYDAALMATSKIMQNSLINYI